MDLIDSKLVQASVIGSMLIDDNTVGPVLGKVTADDFMDTPYRKLYFAIRNLFSAGKPVDPVTVLGALESDHSYEWYDYIED